MADPFLAEIRILGCNFPPRGWALCNGQVLPISQNTALFSLLGTMYGGDGRTTFALPNLQGMTPMHAGQGQGLSQRDVGESGGTEAVTLLASEIPSHTHQLAANTADLGDTNVPGTNTVFAQSAGGTLYQSSTDQSQLDPNAVTVAGGSLPHNNMQPYLTLNFCIALQGIYPPRG